MVTNVRLPHRINNHEIDTEACKVVVSKFDRNWEIRDITGRDFGIDKIVERFEDGYATSEMIMLQVKGTDKEIDYNNPRFSIDTKTLLYAEMFASPFLLVYCSVKDSNQCYYVWLQEYIRVRLNFEKNNWRSQRTNTIYFPQKNILGTDYSAEHLLYISKFPKYKDSWVQYYLCVEDLGYKLPRIYCYEEMCLDEIKYTIEGIDVKLQKAIDCSKNIPQRFIPQEINLAMSIAKEIQDAKEKPPAEKYWELINYCDMIKKSMQCMALRFDVEHLRILYEAEGIADY